MDQPGPELHPADPDAGTSPPRRARSCSCRPGCTAPRATSAAGRRSAAWSTRDARIRRTSGGVQSDRIASMSTDTLVAGRGVLLNRYQLRILPLRGPASTASPTVRSLQAVASRPSTVLPATSRPLLPARRRPGRPALLADDPPRAVPAVGRRWPGVVLADLAGDDPRLLPRPADPASYAWVSSRYADPWVDHVARLVYDYGYDGAGNWAFNTAYAARAHRRGVRDPADQPARGRALHRRRHPAGRVDPLLPRPARRRPDRLDLRPPRRDQPASPAPGTSSSTTPRPPPTPRYVVPMTAASSSAPGSAAPAAPSTSSATPPTPSPPGVPTATGEGSRG